VPPAATWALTTLLFAGTALASVPYPTKDTPKGTDLGRTAIIEGERTITVTVALKLPAPDEAMALLKTISTPGSASYHQFLTTGQFRERFGPSAQTVDKVAASLGRFGLSVHRASTTTLSVSGTPAQLEQAFQTSLHTFSVFDADQQSSYTYRAPVAAVALPPDVAPAVHAVLGLSTRPTFHPHIKTIQGRAKSPPHIDPVHTQATTTNEPGNLTVLDYAQVYDVTPLYAKGITGKGHTVGIVTFAALTPSDAFDYWSAVGLTVDPHRLEIVNIDGGPGAPSDASGSVETTLDVEQSGGVAPGARIVVYQAPNTTQGFVDAFARAIESNQAETISVSWGNWEWYNNLENSPATDPFTGQTVSQLQADHELFLQAALQGQSLFAAAGDAGAYDVNDGNDANGNPLVPPNYTLALSVDNPASDPLILAAGGTTLAGTQTFTLPNGLPDFVVTIHHERVWSWDYLNGLCAELSLSPIACGIFPVGGGGGVSIIFERPSYQNLFSGAQVSQPGQSFIDDLTTPPQLIDRLPAYFPGRNVPDLSANADPDTGYVIYYTSDQSGFGILNFYGGTSFVGPQFNGTAALLGEYLHERLGLLNFPLYELAASGGYQGAHAALRAITRGNNDFYTGSVGYNPAAGLGVVDVGNLAETAKQRGY
jgi:subtilase family serine protease